MKIVFQLTNEQLKGIVWNLKNYGKDPDQEKEVTQVELKDAVEVAEEFFEGLEEFLLDNLQLNEGGN